MIFQKFPKIFKNENAKNPYKQGSQVDAVNEPGWVRDEPGTKSGWTENEPGMNRERSRDAQIRSLIYNIIYLYTLLF